MEISLFRLSTAHRFGDLPLLELEMEEHSVHDMLGNA